MSRSITPKPEKNSAADQHEPVGPARERDEDERRREEHAAEDEGRAMPMRRPVMLVTDIGRAALLVSIPIAYGLDLLTIEQLYVVGFLGGNAERVLLRRLQRALRPARAARPARLRPRSRPTRSRSSSRPFR